MTGMWFLARRGVRAHRGSMVATSLVLGLAAALLSMTGWLLVAGLSAGADDAHGFELVALSTSFAGTALSLVVLVVAATVTLALRQRRRELALLRAVGATGRQVRRLVDGEVLTVTLVAAPVGATAGIALAWFLRPVLEDAGFVVPHVDPLLAPLPVLGATLLLVPTALGAARIAARESLRLSPTAAVGDSRVESREVGRVRRTAALVLALGGVVVACTPVLIPGTMGAATAATSAFLLVAAAALAGPVLVAWTFDRVSGLGSGGRTSATTRLALANVRGFSRRLTTVVVPLALMLAVGTVQTSVNQAVTLATDQQLTQAVGADLVVTGPAGLTPADVATVGALDDVTVTPLSAVPAQVRTEEDETFGSALSWESTGMRVLPAATSPDVLDPGMVDGSLADLAEPGTVAVSTDARFELGVRLGGTLTWRHDGTVHTSRVVAVYDRGLALGPLLASDEALREAGVTTTPDALLLGTRAPKSVVGALAGTGLLVQDVDAYVQAVADASAAGTRLSSVLVLLLLAFAGIGAANAVVLATAGRRSELLLLRRTGATRRQLLGTTFLEAVVTGASAWTIGALAVLPAVLGATFGLLGPALPAVDLATTGLLSAAVLAIPVVCTLATVARAQRSDSLAGGRDDS
ncbi:FtsX-like permease family protein [Cellulomonas gelida]|uniref:ABC3 transporter permease C-terminal domain-containing protein n=1 Tax=Cellulomonas gelida TaxID=1712 RepID=A0A4Y3KI68_9CELL|nr:ABC transporter permease [Cellulomonas gelida]GEA84109.1 hypothetical protein CGE01nite_13600 [Cellulomonas gelida]GGL23224.1 hypothetical protein GCM10009774_11980 [Cellulomonas gelida]